MCGRYLLHTDVEAILEHYGIIKGWQYSSWAPEVFPSNEVTVLVMQKEKELRPMKWGFPAPPQGRGLIINSRGETVDKRPMFRNAFHSRRCIVPASAFYEWSGPKGNKTKYQFRIKERPIFSLAGIYDEYFDKEGRPYKAFTILTINPNPMVSQVHDRMPVILPREQEEIWLDTALKDISLVKSLIKPYDDAEMEMERA